MKYLGGPWHGLDVPEDCPLYFVTQLIMVRRELGPRPYVYNLIQSVRGNRFFLWEELTRAEAAFLIMAAEIQ